MDEDVSYADNISYEEQAPAATEQAASTSLKERIGSRIYLLEDSRKRKVGDLEETGEGEDPEDADNADLTHRSNALLLHGPPISQLPTANVFAYATHFDAHPIGLEWVDDKTCVLVFTNHKHALRAWNALRRPSQAGDLTNAMHVENSEEALFPAPPLPLALYPIEERINSVLGTQKSTVLKETINIRWARHSDVKQPGARVNSEFYKKHGDTAGKESLPGIPQRKRRRYNEDESDTRRKLDAELDSFLDGGDEDMSTNLGGHTGEKQREQPLDNEARRQLDDELDTFLAQGSDANKLDEGRTESCADLGGPSLMNRTTRPLPRRERRGRRPDARMEGENGRWLHNDEMPRRRSRREYDTDGLEVRRQSGRRSRKSHKTQEELDRELEEFLGT